MAFAVDLTGTILDRRYRITGLLGKGGMGHVYEAVHVALDQRVAVKVLHPRYAYEERFRERFLQEARAASKIRHPNVVDIKDFGDTPDESVYFVMEYLRGHDVGSELQRLGTIPWARTRNILLQASSALQAAHNQHIIHRDIKPANCFLIGDEANGLADVVKLLDFGIAKVGSDSFVDAQSRGLTGTGEVFGTASYMSPEQARGDQLDARSDMYSLGIMAYEMLTGQVPFTGVNAIHVITQHLTAKPEPLRTFDGTIPPVVEALVMKMLAKERGDRYSSMAEVERALREIPEDGGPRKTRMWSSPGDPKMLGMEKKAASGGGASLGAMKPGPGGVVRAPTAPSSKAVVGSGAGSKPGVVASAKPGGISSAKTAVASSARPRAGVASSSKGGGISSTTDATDPERTEMVVPTSAPTGGGAKRTVASGDRAPRATARSGAVPVAPPSRVAAAPVMSAPAARVVPAVPVASTSTARVAATVAVASAPVARVSTATPVVPAPAAQAVPAVPMVSAPATHVAPATPVATVRTSIAPSARTHAFGTGSVASPSPLPVPTASGSGSPPDVQVIASAPGWPMVGRGDGTNPPPGRDDSHGSSLAWPASTASTGPNPRVGDTGTETHPHVLEVAGPAGFSGRFLLLVGLLVVLVGVGSVVGTMVVLSAHEGSEHPREEGELRSLEDEPVAAEDAAEAGETPSDEAPAEQKEGVPKGGAAVLELEGSVPEDEALEVERPDLIPGGGNGSASAVEEAEPAEEAVVLAEPEEVADGAGPDQSEQPREPQVPKHETEKCVRTREAARNTLDQRKWSEAARHAGQRGCWPANEQGARRHILINALLEDRRFADCVAAGSKVTDPRTEKMVKTCRERMTK